MTVWVFHLDTVIEAPEGRLSADDYYYASILYDSVLFQGSWWINDGYTWQPLKEEEVPSNHRLMALLLT